MRYINYSNLFSWAMASSSKLLGVLEGIQPQPASTNLPTIPTHLHRLVGHLRHLQHLSQAQAGLPPTSRSLSTLHMSQQPPHFTVCNYMF